MEKYYGWGLPFNASVGGEKIDQLIYIFHGFMAVLFVGWFIFLIIVLFRFRARPGHKANYHLKHFKAPSYIEVAVALFEVVLLVGFAFPIMHQYRNVPPARNESVEIRVVAEQFAWNIHYPGPDGLFGKTDVNLVKVGNAIGLDPTDPAALDDITTINQLHVPVNKPVIVRLSSKDVIHSFSLPVMRVKQDTIPGQEIPVWFTAGKTGKFEIACAQFCGLAHYRMRGFFTVEEQTEFDTWLAKQVKP
ncbi:MAG: cytochrome c oxidase subunit II [Candidatus Omnitrophota bacterium]|nr:cytochrome c oxidase subunit II [Candidatus Omnitrophota bacterium]